MIIIYDYKLFDNDSIYFRMIIDKHVEDIGSIYLPLSLTRVYQSATV